MAIYVSDVINEVLEDLDQSTTAPTHITRAQVLTRLNRCQRRLCREELFLSSSQQAICLATSVRTYNLDSDAYSIAWALYDNEPLGIVTKDQLDTYNVNWLDDSGDPFFILPEFERPHSITVYRYPDSAIAGTYIYLQNFSGVMSDLLDDDTATLGSLPQPLHNEFDIWYQYAMWQARLKRGALMDIQAASLHMNNFAQRLLELKTKAPKKFTIAGQLSKYTSGHRGPSLPSDYPALRVT